MPVNTGACLSRRRVSTEVFTNQACVASRNRSKSFIVGIFIFGSLQRQSCVIFFYIGIIYRSNPRSKMKLQICLTRFWLSSDTPGKQM
ncbi:hypothetical protein DXB77_08810 [Clostridium sp. OM05-9]|nr:hypothetical protein DXB77_08810 [Clostridium sp. OM05-9]